MIKVFYFYKVITLKYKDQKKVRIEEKMNALQETVRDFLSKIIQYCLEIKVSYYLNNSLSDIIFTIFCVFEGTEIIIFLKNQMSV